MRVLLTLLVLAVTVYGIVDCSQADARTRRNVPLWVWVLLMVALPGVGAVIWLVLSRLTTPGPEVPRSRPVAPDDDPEFLRELERRNRERARGEAGAPTDAPQDGPDQTDREAGNDTDRPWGGRS